MQLSVVIPIYNEAAAIREIVRRVQAVDAAKELILGDDFSMDDAGGDRIGSRKCKNFFNQRNCGKGRAPRAGFDHVAGDFVIFQDADLERNLQDYPKLLHPLLSGKADVVFGSRFLTMEQRRFLYCRHSVGNRFRKLLSKTATKLNLTDMETYCKVFRREWTQSIEIEEDRFDFEPEITSKIAKAGARMKPLRRK